MYFIKRLFSKTSTKSLFTSISFLIFYLSQSNFIYAAGTTAFEQCLLQQIVSAEKTTLASELTETCEKLNPQNAYTEEQAAEDSAIHTRLKIEQSNEFKEFTLIPYKPNFILPVSYNHAGYNPAFHQQQFNDPDLEFLDTEAQFQISIKTPLAVNLFQRGINLYTGYTNRSFWQVYNKKQSSPFRETNHEPEIWLQTTRSTKFSNFSNRINMLGISHQSNGRGGELSRSWNRIYADFIFERQSLVFGFKLWKRFNERPEKDDNPDLTEFMGHGELRLIYKSNQHTLSFMSRNNLESSFERGATELGWSFPIAQRKDIKGYVQLFSGYGESLIDYDQRTSRIGFGILLSDWL